MKITVRKITVIFIFILLAALALSAAAFKIYLNSYSVFTGVQLAALVQCREDSRLKEKYLEVSVFADKRLQEKKVFPFRADEWVIEGRVIKWKKFLNLLGLKNYYRLERIRGRYFDLAMERAVPPHAYDLYGRPDKFWFFIYKHRRFLPFVEAVYGSSAFVPFEKEKVFRVYMTNSGFMIKDVSVPKKRSWWQTG